MIPTAGAGYQHQPQSPLGQGAGAAAAANNQSELGNVMQQPITILQRPADAPPYQQNQAVPLNSRIVYSSPSSGAPQTPVRAEKPVQIKTPLALLHEISVKHNIIPKTTLTEDGPVHNRLFVVTTRIEHQGEAWEGTGKARNLQASKQEAARNLLVNIDPKNERIMTEVRKEETILSTPSGSTASPNCSNGGADISHVSPPSAGAIPSSGLALAGNPVGDLAELCMKFKFPMPSYGEEVDVSTGGFINNCTVGEFAKGSGLASTKKQAKRLASAETLKILKEIVKSQLEKQLSSDDVDLKSLARLVKANLTLEDNSNITSINTALSSTNVHFTSLADKLAYFRNCSGPNVDILTKTPYKELQKREPAEVLDQLCEEQQWKTEFADFEPNGDEPKYRSLVSCTVDGQPLFLLSGVGTTTPQARKEAVVNMLGMLRRLLAK